MPLLIVLGILLLVAVILLARRFLISNSFVMPVIGVAVLVLIGVMAVRPYFVLPGMAMILVIAIVGGLLLPELREGAGGGSILGLVLGTLCGGIVIGYIGYAQADPDWADVQTIASVLIGAIGGGGSGAVAGWLLGRYFETRRRAHKSRYVKKGS